MAQKAGPLRPLGRTRPVVLPLTVGEMISLEIGDPKLGGSEDPRPALQWHRLGEGRRRHSGRPLDAAAIPLCRVAVPRSKRPHQDNYEPFQYFAHEAADWLRTICPREVDAVLGQRIRPEGCPGDLDLVKLADREFQRATRLKPTDHGLCLEDIFGWCSFVDHFENFGDQVMPPIWEAEGLQDTAPVVEMLDNMRECLAGKGGVMRFSEDTRQDLREANVVDAEWGITCRGVRFTLGQINGCLHRMVLDEQARQELGPRWSEAIAGAAEFGYPIWVSDLGEVQLEGLWEWGGFASLAKEMRRYLAMMQATGPLVRDHQKRGVRFWIDLVETVHRFARTRPEWARCDAPSGKSVKDYSDEEEVKIETE